MCIRDRAVHPDALTIFGATFDETMDDEIRVTVIATGFDKNPACLLYTSRCGWSEVKIVTVFVSVTAVFCLLAYYGIRGRYL